MPKFDISFFEAILTRSFVYILFGKLKLFHSHEDSSDHNFIRGVFEIKIVGEVHNFIAKLSLNFNFNFG